jgi:hypothetical protein
MPGCFTSEETASVTQMNRKLVGPRIGLNALERKKQILCLRLELKTNASVIEPICQSLCGLREDKMGLQDM